MDDGILVAARGLTRRFGAIVAVDGIDLEVRTGEVFGLLGPNGAGKTTTLRMLLGLLPPTAGEVEVVGRPPGHPEGLARVGALVEEPAHYPYLSGRDNLRVMAHLAAVSPGRVEEVLATVGLTDRGDDKVKGYSLGMRQRLGVAVALLKDPPLLILDEPTNGLDPQGVAAMRELIRTLGRGERTVVLSSHMLAEVEQVCDRAAVIHRGAVVADAPVEELRGGSSVRVVAEPYDEARAVCQEFGRVTPDGGRALDVELDPGSVPDLNARLVAAGVRVFELRAQQRSLEQAFLELTGGATT